MRNWVQECAGSGSISPARARMQLPATGRAYRPGRQDALRCQASCTRLPTICLQVWGWKVRAGLDSQSRWPCWVVCGVVPLVPAAVQSLCILSQGRRDGIYCR